MKELETSSIVRRCPSRLASAFAVCAGLAVLLAPFVARAQTTGIAGAVTDASGAVLPGVTVEAASPVLIEKVRSAVTGERGLYSIVDLRPGVYTVTFTLPGFQTVKREGIELAGTFTATVNAELRVGAVEETITVTGQSPIVDTRNVIQQRVLSDTVRESLPSGRAVQMMAQTIPGIVMNPVTRPSGQDVGGLSGERGVLMIHGSRPSDFTLQLDGSTTSLGAFPGNQIFNLNPSEAQEIVYETGALGAETMAGGVRANVIPKEGGNRYTGQFIGAYASEGMQANNLTEELKALGLQSPNKMLRTWDWDYAAGGPIKRDKLWFFAAYRDWGFKETVAGMFHAIDPTSFVFNPRLGAAGNADLNRPTALNAWLHTAGTRVTWQINEKNKFAGYWMYSPRLQDGNGLNGTVSWEASGYQTVPRANYLQFVWKSPATSHLLFDAAFTSARAENHVQLRDGFPSDRIQVVDAGTGLTYRSLNLRYIDRLPDIHARAAAAYITDAHVAKVGFQFNDGYNNRLNIQEPGSMRYSLRNGVATGITIFNTPREYWYEYRNTGVYAQDQWTFHRFTLNGGIRFDAHTQGLRGGQTSGPGPFAAFQEWPAIPGIADWKDISPRMGTAYDLFGNGKTAVKASLNRYVAAVPVSSFAPTVNPLELNASATRSWTDANGDWIPQESELGPLSNRNFATTLTSVRIDDEFRKGWGDRAYNWEGSVGVQHQLLAQVGMTVSYLRRSFGNFDLTDNLSISPTDFDRFCVTAPTDSRLGSVSGTQICDVYDLNPAKVGQVFNLRTHAKNYGTQKEIFNGIDVSVNARLPRTTIAGGLSSGTSSTTGGTTTTSKEACFVVDSPQALRFCDVNVKWRTGVKFLATTGLPGGVDFGATFQSNPGPEILANYTVTSAQVQGLGRNLTAGSATLPLVPPGTLFGDRVYQVDLRMSKIVRYRTLRARVNLDLANLFNSSAVLLVNNTYGPNWQRPTYILPGRVIKPSVQIDF